jgi:hypothetical protein
MAHDSTAARRCRRGLEEQLAAVNTMTGSQQTWTPAELEVLELIRLGWNRHTKLAAAFDATDDPKASAKLSGEARLTEAHLARLIKSVAPQVPKQESRRSQRGRAAANARWSRETG